MDKSSTVFWGILSHTSAAGYTGRRYIREMAHFQQAMLDSQRVSMHTREELCTCICACVKKPSNTIEMSIKQTIWLGVYRLHLDIIISLDAYLSPPPGLSNRMEMIESDGNDRIKLRPMRMHDPGLSAQSRTHVHTCSSPHVSSFQFIQSR